MSKFKHLEMATAISALPCIKVQNKWFGLVTNVVYQPTGARVDAFQKFYTPEEGKKVEHLLTQKPAQLKEQAGALRRIPQTPVGNLCLSRDRQFVALQLSRFADFTYRAASEVLVFEGPEAVIVAALL